MIFRKIYFALKQFSALFPRLIFLVFLAFNLIFSACEFSFEASTAKLSEAATSLSVDSNTSAPINKSEKFSPDLPAIFATIKLSNAPADTLVSAKFYFLENSKESLITENELKTSGTGYISFELDSPHSGWPEGKYLARYYLNGREEIVHTFWIGDQMNSTKQASSSKEVDTPFKLPPESETRKSGYRIIQEKNFGFNFKIPQEWLWRLTESKDIIVQAPKNSSAHGSTIIFQTIAKKLRPDSSLEEQMKEARGQLLQQTRNAKILKEGYVNVDAIQAPFAIISYDSRDMNKQVVRFAHTQIVAEHPDYYLWISFFAPRLVYEETLAEFDQLVKSLEF